MKPLTTICKVLRCDFLYWAASLCIGSEEATNWELRAAAMLGSALCCIALSCPLVTEIKSYEVLRYIVLGHVVLCCIGSDETLHLHRE
ncbi:hypothetical protein NDU88_012167 [Pleurodeles waltl]|uniref:Uncharacterized protein n=1 Tax=Pleurodeles waltl TaxID=8319 RepID=A0AAV7R173_PLEWA|nr:hypothetical protein NDU88_012167 [Pleurodeles waltl]